MASAPNPSNVQKSWTSLETQTDIQTYRHTYRQTDRQRDRQTDRGTHCLIDEIQTDGVRSKTQQSTEVMDLPGNTETDRQTDRQTERDEGRQTDRHTHRPDKPVVDVTRDVASFSRS